MPGLSPWTGAALTLAAALPLGILSWYCVERPMLRPRPDVASPGPGDALAALGR